MKTNFKIGDVVKHKLTGDIGRMEHVPDGTDKMHYKVYWLTTHNIDSILTEWFVYERLELCELGTLLDVGDDDSELRRCQRYFEKPYTLGEGIKFIVPIRNIFP